MTNPARLPYCAPVFAAIFAQTSGGELNLRVAFAATTASVEATRLEAALRADPVLAYVSSAQQIFTVTCGVGARFPVYFGLVAIDMAAASLLNSRLVGRIGMRRVSHAALFGFLAAGIGLAVLAQAMDPPPLAAFVGLLSLALFAFGLILPNFNALAMEPMGRIAGAASSVIGALTTALAAVLGGYVGQRFDGTVAPLSTGFALFAAAGLAIVLITERGRLFRIAAD